ncbi:hypothetical protein ACLOJK_005793 [Asimina triloba]
MYFQTVERKERKPMMEIDGRRNRRGSKIWQPSNLKAEHMLRKRSRAASSSKQGLMATDLGPLSSPTDSYSRPTSPFFSSPRLFTAFAPKAGAFSDTDQSVMSPTSILDSKTFYSIANPFWADSNPISSSKTVKLAGETCSENRHPWERSDTRGIGLGIVDSLNDEDESSKKFSKPCSRMVLFGSQLKIQIPPLPFSTSSPAASPKLTPNASAEYGIRTPNCPVAPETPSSLRSPLVFSGSLSAIEMELSEDYTCVIAHGPNPRTTHIFDNFIVESCGAIASPSTNKGRNGCPGDRTGYPSDAFLSFCYMCKKDLGQGKDIYMYRGEKAFCSRECRDQEILFEEGRDNPTSDSSAARYSEFVVGTGQEFVEERWSCFGSNHVNDAVCNIQIFSCSDLFLVSCETIGRRLVAACKRRYLGGKKSSHVKSRASIETGAFHMLEISPSEQVL